MGPDTMIFTFWTLGFKPAFSVSSFTFLKGLFSSSLLSAIRFVSSEYLRLLILLPPNFIPTLALSSPEFCMMHYVYELNKPEGNIQPWDTPFPIWNQSIVPWFVLTVAFWAACRFFRRPVRCSGIPISWRIFQFLLIYTVKSFIVVNEAEVDAFLELSCFFCDSTDVGNLISGSSTFSNSSLNNWEFSIHAVLKPSLENFAHYFASIWNECDCAAVRKFFHIALLLELEWKLTFPVLGPLLSFPYFWHIECSTFTA